MAEKLLKGEIRCFPPDLTDDQGRTVHAEVSAVAYDGARLIMASDKPIPGPGRSPVFVMDYDPEQGPVESTLRYLCTPVIRDSAKYEDFALTPCDRYILGTTGFDRVDDASPRLDHYNSLLAWPRRNPDGARAVGRSGDTPGSSSVALRAELAAVLGTPYFKVEGLAAVPTTRADVDGTLLFGVRERGAGKQQFDYVSEIVAVPYRFEPAGMRLVDDMRLIHAFVAHECEDDIAHACGLSSLEYDPYGERLFLLTSFEREDAAGAAVLGGYLWVLPLTDLFAGRRPHLVRHRDGRPVEFVNKAEGLTMLSADRLFVVFDNDRDLRLEEDRGRSRRDPNEAPFTVMEVSG